MRINYTTGYAGTGKSTELINKLLNLPSENSIVLAPTHKALLRLRNSYDGGIELKTIHSMLGWIPTINESAKEITHIEATLKLDKRPQNYKNIVIDEAGMMSEEMLMDLTGKIEEINDFKTDDITIYIYLDPFQLLPVKGLQIQTDPSTTLNLTKQHRSKSIDIVNLYTKFVSYLQETNKLDLTTPYSENVKPFDITKFKRGDRLLAYTNKAVGKWNTNIAKMFCIKSYIGQEVQLGNMLDTVVVNCFLKPTFNELLLLYNTGNLKLQNSNMNPKFLESNLQALISHPHITFIQSDLVYPVIVGIDKANIVLKKAKEAAIKDKSKFRDIYTLGRAFVMDYTFATTIHKSQGSEFENVFIDKEDIQKSIFKGTLKTYARLMYVAISRTKSTLYL